MPPSAPPSLLTRPGLDLGLATRFLLLYAAGLGAALGAHVLVSRDPVGAPMLGVRAGLLVYAAIAALWLLRSRALLRQALGPSLVAWAPAAVAVFVGLILAVGAHALSAQFEMPADNGSPPALMVLAVAVFLAPVCEEVCYRGLLLPSLASALGAGSATGVVTLLFLVAHGSALLANPAALLGIGGLGVATCALRLRTGGIAAPWLCHLSYNAAVAVMVFFA